jgi:heme oxygenase (biliverdin-IX-beta and delta-forming)
MTSLYAPPMRSENFTLSPALTSLRTSTKTRHDVLDKSMPLAKPNVNWADYLEHLHILFAWLKPIEHLLSTFSDGPQSVTAPTLIRYTDIIRKDLGNFFQTPTPQQFSWPDIDDTAYRWGVCYVVEGSQLGGEFLYKRLAQTLSPHTLIYLQRKEPGRWPAFLNCLAAELTTQKQIDKACAGAMDAFDALLMLLPQREYSL